MKRYIGIAILVAIFLMMFLMMWDALGLIKAIGAFAFSVAAAFLFILAVWLIDEN